MHKRITMLLAAAMLLSTGLGAQGTDVFNRGLELYQAGRWQDAVIAFRQAAAEGTPSVAAEALYWTSLSELSAGDYESALRDLDELIASKRNFPQRSELPYQKGRVLFHLGRFDDAIQILKAYSDSTDDDQRKSAAAYWIGECLFSLGRFEEARSTFTLIMEKYPSSAKYEASFYRVRLIDQKSRETELLRLLKWSHEESLKTVEEYQRRERSYEQAIVAYQKRIAEMLKDTRLADLEDQVKEQNTRIAALEASLAEAKEKVSAAEAQAAALAEALETARSTAKAKIAVETPPPAEKLALPPKDASEKLARLLTIKADVLEIKEEIMKKLDLDENGATQ